MIHIVNPQRKRSVRHVNARRQTFTSLWGGTQTNQTVIDSVLQSYEGVIAAETGHVASHEAGAIEASGHKVLTLPQLEGKIQPKDVADYLNQFYSDGT